MKKFVQTLFFMAGLVLCPAPFVSGESPWWGWGPEPTPDQLRYLPSDESFHLITGESIDIHPQILDRYEWITLFSPEHGVDKTFIPMPRSAADEDGDGELWARNVYTTHDYIKDQGEILVTVKNEGTAVVRLWEYHKYRATRGYEMRFQEGRFSLVRRYNDIEIPLNFSSVDTEETMIRVVCYPGEDGSNWIFAFFANNSLLCAFTDVPPEGPFVLFRGKFLLAKYRGETSIRGGGRSGRPLPPW